MLDTLIIGETIRCVDKDRDRYGRLVGECFARDLNLNASMVEHGWALADRQYSTAYVRQGVIVRPLGGMDAEASITASATFGYAVRRRNMFLFLFSLLA